MSLIPLHDLSTVFPREHYDDNRDLLELRKVSVLWVWVYGLKIFSK